MKVIDFKFFELSIVARKCISYSVCCIFYSNNDYEFQFAFKWSYEWLLMWDLWMTCSLHLLCSRILSLWIFLINSSSQRLCLACVCSLSSLCIFFILFIKVYFGKASKKWLSSYFPVDSRQLRESNAKKPQNTTNTPIQIQIRHSKDCRQSNNKINHIRQKTAFTLSLCRGSDRLIPNIFNITANYAGREWEGLNIPTLGAR